MATTLVVVTIPVDMAITGLGLGILVGTSILDTSMMSRLVMGS